MGTSNLLVKAKATGTLPRLNDYVGRFWGGNGDVLGIRSNLEPVKNNGGPSGAVLEQLDGEYPHSLMNLDAGYGDTERTQQLLGVGVSSPSGTFTYDASTDSVKLIWSPDTNNKLYLSVVNKTFEILDKVNATHTRKPHTEIMMGSMHKTPPMTEVSDTVTAHPLGGSVMGKACDAYGRVIGYQGLYVVDGSLIPGSTASTNPSFTIAALAERCVEQIIAKDILASHRNKLYSNFVHFSSNT